MLIDPNKFVGFYDPRDGHGQLSNWFISDFKVGDKSFTSIEQYMMYTKAKVFNDKISMGKIMTQNDPRVIKGIGRSIISYDDRIWSSIRQIVVWEGLMAKFSQDEALKKYLLGIPADCTFVECSPTDTIWGIGLGPFDPDRFDTSKWKGSNLLGGAIKRLRLILGEELYNV